MILMAVICVACVVLCAVGQIFLFFSAIFKVCFLGYKRIKGTVVGHEESSDSEGGTSYFSIIEYCVDGETYRRTHMFGSMFRKSVGEKVAIYYNPKKPSKSLFLCLIKRLIGIAISVGIVVLIFGGENNSFFGISF